MNLEVCNEGDDQLVMVWEEGMAEKKTSSTEIDDMRSYAGRLCRTGLRNIQEDDMEKLQRVQELHGRCYTSLFIIAPTELQ